MYTWVQKKIFIRTLGLLLFFIGVPQCAVAAVRINEIAWMGTAASSRSEWIELANDAETPVSLSEWSIEARDGSPKIALSGVIGAKGYFLIERTNDMTVPNIPADLFVSFGAGLANTGETLELKDKNRRTVDTVAGGANWRAIGGSHATKQTAQRQEDGGGWITGTPTPRAMNIRPEPSASITKKTAEHELLPESSTTTVLWSGSGASTRASGLVAGRNAEWFFLSMGIALSVLAGFIIVRSGRRDVAPADEYSIVEDIIEGVDD